MPITRPASDLQRNISSIYELCHETGEPVYITRNGKTDLVVMDAEAYETKQDLERRVYEREMRINKALIQSQEDLEAGRAIPLSQIRRADE